MICVRWRILWNFLKRQQKVPNFPPTSLVGLFSNLKIFVISILWPTQKKMHFNAGLADIGPRKKKIPN